jgi:hypothetical protein
MNRYFILISGIVVSILFLFVAYNLVYSKNKPMDNFSKSPLNNQLKQEMIRKKIWSSNCPVGLDNLNLLKVSYIDFDGIQRDNGLLVVHGVVADHVLALFKELFNKKFPIASINLINDYNGNDIKSMENNNTSAFNCRNINNSKIISLHSYGLAIDINPQQNPYLITKYDDGKVNIPIFPPLGMEYINRKNIRTGMVETIVDDKETVVDIFGKYGFTVWGGNWNDPIDWHHFQVTREQAEQIANLTYDEGVEFFNKLTSYKISNREKSN